MTARLPIELAGSTLWLLADKAIYWPAQQALLVADVHFGKAAAYRRLGQPGPHRLTRRAETSASTEARARDRNPKGGDPPEGHPRHLRGPAPNLRWPAGGAPVHLATVVSSPGGLEPGDRAAGMRPNPSPSKKLATRSSS